MIEGHSVREPVRTSPFTGKAHIAYIPGERNRRTLKLARAVDSMRAPSSGGERMTRQIAELIQKQLSPKGVAVVLESVSSCMTIRGVKKQGATMFTSQLLGLSNATNGPAPSSCLSFINNLNGSRGDS